MVISVAVMSLNSESFSAPFAVGNLGTVAVLKIRVAIISHDYRDEKLDPREGALQP